MRGQVTRKEWRWVLAWILVVLIITSIPYVIGWLRSTPERVFGGFVIAIEDGYSYLAKMQEGARGAWLFQLPYTSEPHTPTLFYLFHLLLGKIAALFQLPLTVTYHLARLALDGLLLGVVYRFIALFTAWRAVRRIAFLLIVFGGGLGWLLLLAGQGNWLGSIPIDLISPEAYTFLILYALPHLALARTFMLLGLIVLWKKPETGLRSAALAGLCWLVMGIIVPFYVAVIGAIVLAALIADSVALHRFNRRAWGRALLAGLITVPPLIYTAVIYITDPIWKVWADQLVILSPHPLHYVLGYLVVGSLALIGIVKTWRQRVVDPKLIGWLIAVPLLLYLPFNSQRRLIEGWQIPLSICAAIGLAYGVLPAWRKSRVVRRLTQQRRYTAHGLRAWLLASFVLLLGATYVLLLVEQSARMIAQQPPSFRTGGEVAALHWLDQRVTYEDVILSSYETGNFLPAIVGAKAFLGHGPETAYSEAKRQLVHQFYAADTSDEWRRSFLRQWPITYVFQGPLEQQPGTVDLSHAGYLTLEYDRDGYQIYRVVEAGR